MMASEENTADSSSTKQQLAATNAASKSPSLSPTPPQSQSENANNNNSSNSNSGQQAAATAATSSAQNSAQSSSSAAAAAAVNNVLFSSHLNDEEKQWLQQSTESFNKRQYSSCLKCLQNLLQSIQSSTTNEHGQTIRLKLAMNKAVCEFAHSSFRKVNDFKQSLKTCILNSSNNTGSSSSSSSSSSTNATTTKLDLEKLETLEDSHHSIIFFNYAVLLFYLKQYSDCLNILEKIYTNFIESLDEEFSLRLCASLINLYIELKQPFKALSVLKKSEATYLVKKSTEEEQQQLKSEEETTNNNNNNNNKSATLLYYSSLFTVFRIKCFILTNSASVIDRELKQLISPNHNSPQSAVKLSTIANLKMSYYFLNENHSAFVKQLIIDCVTNLKALDSSLSSNVDIQSLLTIANTPFNLTSSASTNLNGHHHSTNQLHQQQQQQNSILNVLTGGANPNNAGSNSLSMQMQQQSNNILFKIFTLTKCLTEITSNSSSDDEQNLTPIKQNIASLNTLFFNNIALVNFSLQKYNLSSLFFQRALEENRKLMRSVLKQQQQQVANDEQSDESSSSSAADSSSTTDNYLRSLAMNRHNEIVYNLGISYLLSKQPVVAFEYLHSGASVYNQNVRLWLRLAECCIMYANNTAAKNEQREEHHHQELENIVGNERMLKSSEKLKCIRRSVGGSFHHKIVLGSDIGHHQRQDLNQSLNLNISQLKEFSPSKLMSYEYAYSCLKNAFELLPSNEEIFGVSAKKPSAFSSGDLSSSSSKHQSKIFGVLEPNLAGMTSQLLVDNLVDETAAADETTSINNAVNNESSTNSCSSKLFNIVWPSKPIDMVELQSLRASVLINLAYVALTLRDYLSTIKYCNCLLSNEDQFNLKYPISNGHKYLAHFYLSEALVFQDKISEALDNLGRNSKIDAINDISFLPPTTSQTNHHHHHHQQQQQHQHHQEDPFTVEDSVKSKNQTRLNQLRSFYPRDIKVAQAIAFYNLSVGHVIRNELDIAYRYFNMCVQLFEKKQPVYTYFMKLFLDLLDGNRQSLQYVLKDHFGHVTLNRSTQLISNTATNLNLPLTQQQQQQQQQQANRQQQNVLPQTNQQAAAAAAAAMNVVNQLHPHQIQQLQQQQQTHFHQQQTPAAHLQHLQQAQQLQQQLQIQLLQQQLQQQQQQSHLMQQQQQQQPNNNVIINTLAAAAVAAAAEKNQH